MIKISILILSVLFFTCCGGGTQHCIAVKGDYQGIGGEVSYCFKPEASKIEGAPVLEELAADGTTQKLIAVSANDLEDANRELAAYRKAEAEAVSKGKDTGVMMSATIGKPEEIKDPKAEDRDGDYVKIDPELSCYENFQCLIHPENK